jgi:hypothetical protein
MGCWNHTCAVTNLPIFWEEEVEVILLRSDSFSSGSDDRSYCYPYSRWSPIPLTFSGTYNDYGAVENCKGPALDIIVDTIRKNLDEREEFKDEHDYTRRAITKEGFDIDDLFDLDHDGLLRIKNPIPNHDGPKTCRIKHIVVRKDVYEGIVTKTKLSRWWDSKPGVTLTKIDKDVFTKDLDNFFDPDSLPSVDDYDLGDIGEKEILTFRRSLKRYQMYEGIGDSMTSTLLTYKGQGPIGVDRPVHPMEILTKLREEKSDLYEGVLDNALRFAFFNLFMNDARKTYTVPSGAGSQDDTTKAQELCARLTLSSAKAQRKWQKDRYEE